MRRFRGLDVRSNSQIVRNNDFKTKATHESFYSNRSYLKRPNLETQVITGSHNVQLGVINQLN